MIKVLLDFPWAVSAALEPDPRPKKLIADFLRFLEHVPFKPASFVNQEEEIEFNQNLLGRHGSGVADIFRFLQHVRHNSDSNHRAVPINGPDDLRPAWERALRDHIDLDNWRTPQIVVSSDRMVKWKNCINDHEVRLVLEDTPDTPQSRLVVRMASYERSEARRFGEDFQAHKYALADMDPWNVRHIYYPTGEGRHYATCRLPRPRYLEGIPLERLDEELKRLRSESWPDKTGRYWYLPPAGWHPVEVLKEDWRKGAFPEKATQNLKREHKRGPVDYSNERVWLWDSYEGHWDVQLPGGKHKRINHEGICRDD